MRTNRTPSARAGRRSAALLVAGLLSIGSVLFAAPAGAHGEEGSVEGYTLVQQALGHLAHDSSDEGAMLAMEKIDDVLAAEDQDGVDVAQVDQARAALMTGDVPAGQALLQSSITEALAELTPAVGEETGTTVVLEELPGRADLSENDFLFLAVSVLLLVVGALMAWRFRPADTVRELRTTLADASPDAASATTSAATSQKDAS